MSSRHCAHILAVTLVLAAIHGQELISISQGRKSSVSIKSAPYSSKQPFRLSTVSCDARSTPTMACFIPEYIKGHACKNQMTNELCPFKETSSFIHISLHQVFQLFSGKLGKCHWTTYSHQGGLYLVDQNFGTYTGWHYCTNGYSHESLPVRKVLYRSGYNFPCYQNNS